MSFDQQGKFYEEPIDSEQDLQLYAHHCKLLRVLYDIHHDIWTDDIYQEPFTYSYTHILWPKEREIVDFKVSKKSIQWIAKKLKTSTKTIERSLYNIKYVFRNRARPRIPVSWYKENSKIKFRRKYGKNNRLHF